MLDENTPPICPGQKNPSVVYAESFDNGLGAWTVSNQGLNDGWPGKDWTTTSGALPRGRIGTAAYAENFDPLGLNCGDDLSGASRTSTSPARRSLPRTR